MHRISLLKKSPISEPRPIIKVENSLREPVFFKYPGYNILACDGCQWRLVGWLSKINIARYQNYGLIPAPDIHRKIIGGSCSHLFQGMSLFKHTMLWLFAVVLNAP